MNRLKTVTWLTRPKDILTEEEVIWCRKKIVELTEKLEELATQSIKNSYKHSVSATYFCANRASKALLQMYRLIKELRMFILILRDDKIRRKKQARAEIPDLDDSDAIIEAEKWWRKFYGGDGYRHRPEYNDFNLNKSHEACYTRPLKQKEEAEEE